MIPKVIHYCWFGGNQLPAEYKNNIESWKKFCPDYEIKRWDETNYDVSKCQYMHDAYIAKKWGFVPDFARLDIIAENGGFYFDTDVELVKSLDELRNNAAFFGMETGGLVACGLGFGAEKDNELIKQMRDNYFAIPFVDDMEYLQSHTDPNIQTDFLEKHGFVKRNVLQQVGTATIYPVDYFCPMDMKTGLLSTTENTFSIHKYAGTWAGNTETYGKELRWMLCKKYGKIVGRLLWPFPYSIYVLRHDGFRVFWIKAKKKLKKAISIKWHRVGEK